MKILYIHASATKMAGSEKALITLLHQTRDIDDITVLLPEEGLFSDFLRDSDVSVIVHKLSGFNRFNPFPFLMTLMVFLWTLARVKPDLVHCSSLSPVQYAGLWCRILGIPLITHVQCPYDSDDTRRYLPQLADRIILVARNLAGTLPEELHPKLSTIYSGIEIPQLDRIKERQSLAQEYSFKPDLSCIGIFGQVIERKGVDYFLFLMAQLKRQTSGFRAFIVGDDTSAYAEELKILVSHLGLKDQVIWTGYRKEVKPLMAAMDVILMPSRKEGFGLVAAEAFSVGTPVMAANTGGLAEIVDDAENGYLIAMADVRKEAAQLKFLLDNPVVRKQMGEKGLKKVQRVFSQSQQKTQLDHLYASLLKEQKATAWLGRTLLQCLSLLQRIPAALL